MSLLSVPSQELGFGSGMTCRRRLRDWHQAGVWQKPHELLLAELYAAGKLDWSEAVIDSSLVRALKSGPRRVPGRSAARRRAPKHHVIADGNGVSLALSLTGGNRNDVAQFMPLLRAVPL
ncbi:hypothetical protein [Microbispora amethystogenes]|uniref:Transposase n=1 Tax=Microbispora amethystogenes TaxID=1427754 RepID=A0ABQ4FF11_9ACTN|nr:hypothetical protein [Microbispora amethystogenes]GIH33383.1 hypothetical protein Mam01_35470 [Microbispora amethystogenes]